MIASYKSIRRVKSRVLCCADKALAGFTIPLIAMCSWISTEFRVGKAIQFLEGQWLGKSEARSLSPNRNDSSKTLFGGCVRGRE